MALSLKGTGLAASAKIVLAVDDDGTTIKDFVNNRTVGSGLTVANGSITVGGTTSWRSSGTVSYITATSTPRLTFTAVSVSLSTGMSVYAAVVASSDSAEAQGALVGGDFALSTDDPIIGIRTSDDYMYIGSSGSSWASSGSVPQDGSTKFSYCAMIRNSDSYAFYSANESTADLSANGGSSIGNVLYTPQNIRAIFNVVSGYSRPFDGSVACIAVFEGKLSQSDFDTLHDDWKGVLFEAPASKLVTPLSQFINVRSGLVAANAQYLRRFG